MRLIAAALLLLGACCKTCPPPQVITKPAAQCLTAAPPSPPRVTFAACEGFEACLSLQDAAALAQYEDAARSWMKSAWTLCGPLPAGGK